MKEIFGTTTPTGRIVRFYEDGKDNYIKRTTSDTYNQILSENEKLRSEFNRNDTEFRKSEFRRVAQIPKEMIEIKMSSLGLKLGEFSDWISTVEGRKWLKSDEMKICRTVGDDYKTL